MAFRIALTNDVDRQVASFPEPLRVRWDHCLEEITLNPFPRTALHFDISEETSISDEDFFAFAASWLPDYAILYVARRYGNRELPSDEEGEVIVFYLRQLSR